MRKLSLATRVAFWGCFTHPALAHRGCHRPPLGLRDDTPGRLGECPYKATVVPPPCLPWPVFHQGNEAMSLNWEGRGQLALNSLIAPLRRLCFLFWWFECEKSNYRRTLRRRPFISMLFTEQNVLGSCYMPCSLISWGHMRIVYRKGKRSRCGAELQGCPGSNISFIVFYFCEALKVHAGPRTWEGR